MRPVVTTTITLAELRAEADKYRDMSVTELLDRMVVTLGQALTIVKVVRAHAVELGESIRHAVEDDRDGLRDPAMLKYRVKTVRCARHNEIVSGLYRLPKDDRLPFPLLVVPTARGGRSFWPLNDEEVHVGYCRCCTSPTKYTVADFFGQ